MDPHSSSSHCLRVNCVSLFFRLLFIFCFQQSNSGEPRCGFLWVYPAWVTWTSKICMLRFFASNLRKFPQVFFWPNLSPSRTPITQTLDYLILSLTWHWGSVHFFSFFFYSVLQLEWFLLTFYWPSRSLILSSIVPKLPLNHLVNFSFKILYFSVVEFLFGCFLNFHFSTEIPICLLIMFLWGCI